MKKKIERHLIVSLSLAATCVVFLWIFQFNPSPDAAEIQNRTYGLVATMPLVGYLMMSIFFIPLFIDKKKSFGMPGKMTSFFVGWVSISFLHILGLFIFAGASFLVFAPLLMKYFPGPRDTRLWMNILAAGLLWGSVGGYSQYRLIKGFFKIDSRQETWLKYGMTLIGVFALFIPLACVGWKLFGYEYLLFSIIALGFLGGWQIILSLTGPFSYYKKEYIPLREQQKRRLKP